MQLSLLGTSVKKIIEYSGLVYHFTEAGVDVHSIFNGTKMAYASLANTTCGAVNKNGVYLGTTAGVLKLTHASVSTGGDRTADLTPIFTHTNAIHSMAGYDYQLFVGHDAGATYWRTEELSNSYDDASGVFGVDMYRDIMSYISVSLGPFWKWRRAEDWTAEQAVKIVDQITNLSTLLSSPNSSFSSAAVATVVGNPVYDVAFMRTNNLNYIRSFVKPSVLSNNTTFTSTNAVGTPENTAFATSVSIFSPDGLLFVGGSTSTQTLDFYKYNPTTRVLTLLQSYVAFGTAYYLSAAFSPDSQYLIVGGKSVSGTAYNMRLFKFVGDTVVNLQTIRCDSETTTSQDVRGLAWSTQEIIVAQWYSSASIGGIKTFSFINEVISPLGVVMTSNSWGTASGLTGALLATGRLQYVALHNNSIRGFSSLFSITDDGTLQNVNHGSLPAVYSPGGFSKFKNYVFVRSSTLLMCMRIDGTQLSYIGSFQSLTTSYYPDVIPSLEAILFGHSLSPNYGFLRYFVYDSASSQFTQSYDTAVGDKTVFVGTDSGVFCFDCNKDITNQRLIGAEVVGEITQVRSIDVTAMATRTSGLLAYGTDDGFGTGSFGIVDLSA
jgi:hypothetical protein